MPPENLRPVGFNTFNIETWDRYKSRIGLDGNEAENQFYRQVVYDHFEHFNEHYPTFELHDYEITMIEVSAAWAYDKIRYFQNEPMDDWNIQYDQFKECDHNYIIHREMTNNKTPPFPPVIIESSMLIDKDWKVYGRNIHLIEGTHRVSYLRRMLELGEISSDSLHMFVLLKPRQSA